MWEHWHKHTGIQGIRSVSSSENLKVNIISVSLLNETCFVIVTEQYRLMTSVFLPHSWQLFISKADQKSHCWVSSSYLLRFQSFSWFAPVVNMLFVFFLLCSQTSACRAAQLLRFLTASCSAAAEAASSLDSLHPTFPPPPNPLPSLCLVNFPKANKNHPDRHSMYALIQLYYVMDEDSLNIRQTL